MEKYIKYYIILIMPFFFSSTVAQEAGKKMEKISLSVPKLTEEETDSNHIPHHMRCDACLAVAYQIQEAFTKEQSKKPKIKESDIIDILEQICNKGFSGYGVKQVNGKNRLSGPGLETEHVMGMTQMGGRWPHRLQEMCHNYVGEAGELDIYEAFTQGQDELSIFLCHGKGIYSHCVYKVEQTKNEL